MKNLLIVLAACTVIAVSVYFSNAPTAMFLNSDESNAQFGTICLAIVAMLAGIVAGRMHNRLMRLETVQPKRLLAEMWTDKDLWKSLLASPLIFGVVYSFLSKSHDVVLTAIFSFQNGFFCYVVFANLAKKQPEIPGQQV
jgi:hypothetical protein